MTETNRAEEQAKAQYESVREMVAALECDYDRLEELREELRELKEVFAEQTRNIEWNDAMFEHAEELRELEEAAGDCESEDDARQRISEDALSIEVRSDWTTPGEEMTPGEFCIVLCTGGPAARIVGELDEHGEPYRAQLEYQDRFARWKEYFGADQETLLTYARQFVYRS